MKAVIIIAVLFIGCSTGPLPEPPIEDCGAGGATGGAGGMGGGFVAEDYHCIEPNTRHIDYTCASDGDCWPWVGIEGGLSGEPCVAFACVGGRCDYSMMTYHGFACSTGLPGHWVCIEGSCCPERIHGTRDTGTR